jgi:hypothetical protein
MRSPSPSVSPFSFHLPVEFPCSSLFVSWKLRNNSLISVLLYTESDVCVEMCPMQACLSNN